MPLTSPISYAPTLREFIAHWNIANAEMGAEGPLLLKGGFGVGDLAALLATLEGQRADVEDARNGVEIARADLETRKAALLGRLNGFAALLRLTAEGTFWPRLLPGAWSSGDAMGKVVPALEQALDAWDRYEAEHPPLVLAGGYGRADFAAEAAALRALYSAKTREENGLRVARGRRTMTEKAVRPALSRYRATVAVTFAEGSAVRACLPRLTPRPGHTPEAPDLRGRWDAEAGAAVLEWTPPEDEAVVKLQLRATAGPKYEADDERARATFSPTDPPLWQGPEGWPPPGAAESYKLYAMTAEGNEKASQAVTVARPPG